MQILEQLKSRLIDEESLFRSQLMREDIGRLEQLIKLAGEAADVEDFLEAGLYIGWTQNDMRTHQIEAPVKELLRVVFSYQRGVRTDTDEELLSSAWQAFDHARMTTLIRCL